MARKKNTKKDKKKQKKPVGRAGGRRRRLYNLHNGRRSGVETYALGTYGRSCIINHQVRNAGCEFKRRADGWQSRRTYRTKEHPRGFLENALLTCLLETHTHNLGTSASSNIRQAARCRRLLLQLYTKGVAAAHLGLEFT